MEALHMSKDIGHLALRHDDRRTWAPFGTDRLEVFVNKDIEHFFVKRKTIALRACRWVEAATFC